MTINSYFYDSVDNDRLGGTNYTTIYAGKATVQGHFVEIPDTEILNVTGGTYSGMVVIRIDFTDTRIASLVVRTDRVPQQDTSAWELPLRSGCKDGCKHRFLGCRP